MKIKVQILSQIPGRLNWKDKVFDVKVEDIKGFLETAASELKDIIVDKEKGEILPSYKILVNGRDVSFMEGLKTRLRDEDRLDILSLAGGG